MRFDDEHTYDQVIYDLPTIYEHLIPEHRYKKLVSELAKVQGNIIGAYWLIDVICALYPADFPQERKDALKRLTMKIYTAYDDAPTNKQMTAIMSQAGYSVKVIATTLHISRNTVYYFLARETDLPTRCMLTYGEYNVMMDFLDIWDIIKEMGELK